MSDLGEMTGLQPRVVEGRSEAVDRHSPEHPVTRYVLYKSPLTGLAPMGWTGVENSGKRQRFLGRSCTRAWSRQSRVLSFCSMCLALTKDRDIWLNSNRRLVL